MADHRPHLATLAVGLDRGSGELLQAGGDRLEGDARLQPLPRPLRSQLHGVWEAVGLGEWPVGRTVAERARLPKHAAAPQRRGGVGPQIEEPQTGVAGVPVFFGHEGLEAEIVDRRFLFRRLGQKVRAPVQPRRARRSSGCRREPPSGRGAHRSSAGTTEPGPLQRAGAIAPAVRRPE